MSELKNVAKKIERYQEYFDTRGEEILKLRKEKEELQKDNERYQKALMRFVEDETVTWEQTETIAKRALRLPPYQ